MMNKVRPEDTGERMIPEYHKRTIMYAEHITRYLAAKKIASNKTVLDIASGSGYGTNMLSEVANKVYGVDNSEEAIRYSEENFRRENVEFIIGSAEDIPLEDNSVDLVVSFETIEHVKDYKKLVREIRRVLRDNGLAIISTPNIIEFAKNNEFHVHEFGQKELTDLLSKEFKYLKPLYQTTWAYVQLSDDKYIQTDEAVSQVEVHNLAPLQQDKYSYFYFLCSNRKITENIPPIGATGGHYSARELEEIFTHNKKHISESKLLLENEKYSHKKAKIKLIAKERELHHITTSRSFLLARKMTAIKKVGSFMVQKIRELDPRSTRMLSKNRKYVRHWYESETFTRIFSKPAESKTAVILHLYYPDMLKFFAHQLKKLRYINHDLYITLPETKKDLSRVVSHAFPNARIAIVPNCGRDVLPFIQILKGLEKMGYEQILKLHSKKSPHRNDGIKWRNNIIEILIPSDTKMIKSIINTLSKPSTGVIGPKGQYISLLVNLSATAHYIKNLIGKIINGPAASDLLRTADEYGFFGGTMFWARVDALTSLVNNVDMEDFEPELGQEDSTLAHAPERLFNIVPEIEGKKMFESSEKGIIEIEYHTNNIPEWSEINIK